jgi:transposase
MYLRHSTIRKDGKSHTYWRLVRSVRYGRKVRQETVAMLGELDAEGRLKARSLARQLCGKAFETDLFEEDLPAEPIPARLDRIYLERGRRFGDAWLAWTLWRGLGLDTFLGSVLGDGREEVPWSVMAAISVMARLCEPSSELHLAEDWYRGTALEDLVEVPIDKVNKDRLYRTLDKILPHKRALEGYLKNKLGKLFDLEYDLFLYDLTSTYFEGLAKGNPQAKHGHSSDQRSDCKQVLIALVVTRDGIPVGYEVFDGNRHGSTTVEEIVTGMEARYGKADRIWVMDRGMVSTENIDFLIRGGRRYIVGTPKGMLKHFQKELLSKDWESIRKGLEVKRCPSPDGRETFILCRSDQRREKEKAMHDRFEKRIEDGLLSMVKACEKRKQDPIAIARRVGRLMGQNSRAAGLFKVDVRAEKDGRAKVSWSKEEAWRDWANLSEGCYLLRSNVNDWSGPDLWRAYIQLTEAETAFRTHKHELDLRPIGHQTRNRVQAHILVCFLAYVLYKTLAQWQRRAGLGNSPQTILTELARIQSTDVIIPLADGQEARLRCVVRPDEAQTLLLDRLGLELPKRLNLPGSLKKCSANFF